MNSSKKFQIKITLKQPVFIDPKIEDRNLRLSAVFSPKSGAECGLEENCKTKAAFYEPVLLLKTLKNFGFYNINLLSR